MYNHIKWNYGVTGYLSKKEKQICNEIDALASSIIAKGKDISTIAQELETTENQIQILIDKISSMEESGN